MEERERPENEWFRVWMNELGGGGWVKYIRRQRERERQG